MKKTDAREIESFYQQYYKHYVSALDQGEQADRYFNDCCTSAHVIFYFVCGLKVLLNAYCIPILDRAQLGKAYQTAGVLFEVLCAVNKTEKVEEVAPEVRLINCHLFLFCPEIGCFSAFVSLFLQRPLSDGISLFATMSL